MNRRKTYNAKRLRDSLRMRLNSGLMTKLTMTVANASTKTTTKRMRMAKTLIWKISWFMDRTMTILVQLTRPCVKNLSPMSRLMNVLSSSKSLTQ